MLRRMRRFEEATQIVGPRRVCARRVRNQVDVRFRSIIDAQYYCGRLPCLVRGRNIQRAPHAHLPDDDAGRSRCAVGVR